MDVDFLKKLVEFETTAGNFREMSECVQLCRDELGKSGLKCAVSVKNGVPSLVCNVKNNSSELLLTGHLDVIEGKKGQFKPYVEGGKLFGRGAADMKGGCAVAVSVMKKLVEENRADNVGLVFTCDEETGGHSGMEYIASRIKTKFATTLEPQSNRDTSVIVKHKGLLWVKLVAEGKAAHGSKPWLGENAAEKLIAALPKALSLASASKKPVWANTVNLGTINAGLSANRVPDEASATLDYRLVRDSDAGRIKKRLAKIRGVKATVIQESRMLGTDSRNHFVKKFAKVASSVWGRKIGVANETYFTDVRWFCEKKVPAIVFGPYGENIHADDEWVDLSSCGKVEEAYLKFAELF
ncbi:M20/M25/M40 family metallo-hydrolase [Candidatus Micrarchaeota archaeon]|nr:M20/M25/M40 family metallo-hydrolase [Candidatus Micrarchaeota archaeon]